MKNLCLTCSFWSKAKNKCMGEKGDYCRIFRDKI